jgi:hypothetical protein
MRLDHPKVIAAGDVSREAIVHRHVVHRHVVPRVGSMSLPDQM